MTIEGGIKIPIIPPAATEPVAADDWTYFGDGGDAARLGCGAADASGGPESRHSRLRRLHPPQGAREPRRARHVACCRNVALRLQEVSPARTCAAASRSRYCMGARDAALGADGILRESRLGRAM